MPSNYTGNPIATQAPGPQPALDALPVGALLVDGDTLNASAFNQAYKESLDWIAFLTSTLSTVSNLQNTFSGVRAWRSDVTYHTDDLVIYSDHKTYRAIATSTNAVPSSSPSSWVVWGHTNAEVASYVDTYFAYTGTDAYKKIVLPGGIVLLIEKLANSLGQLPASGSQSHTFAVAFPSTCFAAFFQPVTYDPGHSLGAPTILPQVTSNTAISLVLAPQGDSANGYVSTGYLFSIGY